MKNEIEAMITDITTTTTEAEDYTGEDGLLYCGKCHTPKEAYFAEGKTCFGRDRYGTPPKLWKNNGTPSLQGGGCLPFPERYRLTSTLSLSGSFVSSSLFPKE